MQGFFGAVWGAWPVSSGPLLEARIISSFSWRWIFLVNVPPGLAAMAVLGWSTRRTRGRSRPLRSICWAQARSPWPRCASCSRPRSGAPIATGSAGIAPAAGFVWVERRAADPVLPLSLLGRRLIAVTTSASLLTGAAMMGVLTFLPLHVQGVLGRWPTEAGLVIAPMLVGWPIASTGDEPHDRAHRVSPTT
ncbi:MAG: hypothetical protein IPG04_38445 [Polyangiaceae bacterium]|nr:hypothetical protein [Polyangiaceae bacterium]